jgi:hypothetical protein
MRDILVTAIVSWSALFYVLKRSHYGAYLWAWLSYMNPHKQCWGFAMNMPFAYVTFLVTAISMFMSKEPKRIPWTTGNHPFGDLHLVDDPHHLHGVLFQPCLGAMGTRSSRSRLGTFMTLMLINLQGAVRIFIWIIACPSATTASRAASSPSSMAASIGCRARRALSSEGTTRWALVMIMTVPLMRYLHLTETKAWVKHGPGRRHVPHHHRRGGQPVAGGLGGPGRHGHHALAKEQQQIHDRPADRS